MTEFPITALRSVELATPNLDLSERFYRETWRLEPAGRVGERLYLAASGTDHHVLTLVAADAPALCSITFRAASEVSLRQLVRAAEQAGSIVILPEGPNDGPEGGRVASVREPRGCVLRLVHGDRRKADTTDGRPVPTRLAHVNINSRDPDALAAFYGRALGFRLTDRSKLMAFVRTNADHHAVVVAEAPVEGLNHVAFLMPDLESVMRGAGRLIDHGVPIGWGVGRHGPGDNVFAYFVDPTGVVVEYTAEVLQVDDDYHVRGPSEWSWPPGRTDHWGIAPPKPDHVKAAQLAVPFVS